MSIKDLPSQVRFGKPRGEKTLASVVRINGKTVTVRTLEHRNGRPIGQEWRVPFSMLYTADGQRIESTKIIQSLPHNGEYVGPYRDWPSFANKPATPVPNTSAVKYNPFEPSENQLAMEGILCCYAKLSPEALHADGEASPAQVRHTLIELNRKLRGFFVVLGRNVREEEAYEWHKQKNAQEELDKAMGG